MLERSGSLFQTAHLVFAKYGRSWALLAWLEVRLREGERDTTPFHRAFSGLSGESALSAIAPVACGSGWNLAIR